MILTTVVCRRKQKNPKSLTAGVETSIEAEHDRSFEGSNGSGVSSDESKDISELVKVEINNSSDDIENNAEQHNESQHADIANPNLRFVSV